jgi:isocitrate/isopropylmalate dehydrogenase
LEYFCLVGFTVITGCDRSHRWIGKHVIHAYPVKPLHTIVVITANLKNYFNQLKKENKIVDAIELTIEEEQRRSDLVHKLKQGQITLVIIKW